LQCINQRSLLPSARGYVPLVRFNGAPSPVAADSSASHIACMVAKTPKRRKASNPLVSALARWESEGGAATSPCPSQRERSVSCSALGRRYSCSGMICLHPSSGNFRTRRCPGRGAPHGGTEGANRFAFFTSIRMTSGDRSDALPADPLSSRRRALVAWAAPQTSACDQGPVLLLPNEIRATTRRALRCCGGCSG
jgi:hypothetical protein